MIRVADYIVQRLANYGIKHVFMVTGGGAMFLNYSELSRGCNVFNHHKQASAMSAKGYAPITGKTSTESCIRFLDKFNSILESRRVFSI